MVRPASNKRLTAYEIVAVPRTSEIAGPRNREQACLPADRLPRSTLSRARCVFCVRRLAAQNSGELNAAPYAGKLLRGRVAL
jgi:hypothetical protein